MLRWIRNRRQTDQASDSEQITPGQQAASAALRQARDALHQVRGLHPQVTETAARLRQRRAENHFAEAIRLALGGGHE